MKKILVINGHPNKKSFNQGLSNAYKNGAERTGNDVKEIVLSDLNFNPNLELGYEKRTELESDLLEAWELIKWAEHIVWVYPQWWGFMPALLKGFIDRLFLPGFAFKPDKNNPMKWDKLLIGKTAHIIHTLDYPVWYYKLFMGSRGVKVMKKQVLEYVGIKTEKITLFAPIATSDEKLRKKWIKKIEAIGEKAK